MDTRTKILGLEEAAEAAERARRAGKLVGLTSGWFDPLTAAHLFSLPPAPDAVQFAAIGEAPDALLPERARAELVAALRAVDYVIIAVAETAEAALRPDCVVRAEAEHDRQRQELIRHVHSRQSAR